jgi:hypothetical protein
MHMLSYHARQLALRLASGHTVLPSPLRKQA